MEEFISDFKDELEYVRYKLKDGEYYIYCETKSTSFKHPTKDLVTTSVKSRYNKTVKDLPFNNKSVNLVIKVKMYTFKEVSGEQKSFMEKLNFLSNMDKNKRRTKRLDKYILDVAATTSSHAAEKILRRHGVEISDTTIDRMILKKTKN